MKTKFLKKNPYPSSDEDHDMWLKAVVSGDTYLLLEL